MCVFYLLLVLSLCLPRYSRKNKKQLTSWAEFLSCPLEYLEVNSVAIQDALSLSSASSRDISALPEPEARHWTLRDSQITKTMNPMDTRYMYLKIRDEFIWPLGHFIYIYIFIFLYTISIIFIVILHISVHQIQPSQVWMNQDLWHIHIQIAILHTHLHNRPQCSLVR